MNIRKFPQRCLVLVTVAAGSAVVTWCWSHRIWSFGQLKVYLLMKQQCHPVWYAFHYGEVRAGDPVDEVILKTLPPRVIRHGQWTILEYYPKAENSLSFTGVFAAAWKGRMIAAYAWSCTWQREFFNRMTARQQEQFFASYWEQAGRGGRQASVR